jgi:hypothetical protein
MLTDKVKSGLLLDVVVRKCSSILKLLSGENETLLVGGDALLVLDLRLDHVDGVRGLHLEGDCERAMLAAACAVGVDEKEIFENYQRGVRGIRERRSKTA